MPQSDDKRIVLDRVSKRFPKTATKGDAFLAVSDVSFSVGEGEVIALTGASGCGKTTVLRMMAGLTPHDEGDIHVNGVRVSGIPPSIGFVFQQPSLLPSQTVSSNLRFVLKRLRLPTAEVEERVQATLTLTGLEAFGDSYPHTLSGGMQQRVGLARALAIRPQVLYMDEPLSALDAFTRVRLQQDICHIVEASGATTVLVTHDVDEAIFFADRVIVMSPSPGRIAHIIDVPLPRPRRHQGTFGDPAVAGLREQILSAVFELR